jgi:hypothetical protein
MLALYRISSMGHHITSAAVRSGSGRYTPSN